MQSILRKFTTGAIVAGILTAGVTASSPAGYVDFGSFDSEVGEPFFEVNINSALIKIAATLAKYKDPEVAELLANIEHVHVNVIGIDDSNRAEATGRIEGIRADLDAQGWARIVTVRENSGDNVAVFIKQADDDSIQGIAVTIISRDGEAVLVNVVGDVQLEQIAKLGARLDIDPLRKLNLKSAPVKS